MCAIELYTYDDYKKWEGEWELIDGIAYAMAPSPLRIHQNLAYEIAFRLREAIDNCKNCEVLGEMDYKIDEYTVLKPDVVLTCNETNEDYLIKTPQIVVEVISKSSAKRDEEYKFKIYEKEKVPYYVLVYPDGLYAKVYKHNGKNFEKVDIFTNEKYNFETECEVEIDFKKVFERFRGRR